MRVPLRAGQIVLVDWRDALPEEPNKRRPAVVVQDDALFDDDYPNAIVVPLTEAAEDISPSLAVAIAPTAENGCSKPCVALAANVTAASKRRIRPTASRITAGQLADIRERIALAVGAA